MESHTTTPVRGRPRDGRADRAILTAALELISKNGVHDLRMDDVADRARVGKATIYRRYRSKEELVTAAVSTLVSEIVIPDMGSTRADLLVLMREAVDVYTGSLAAGAVPSLVEAMRRDPELARTVRRSFLAGRREALKDVLDRGIARGELSADLDRELALDVLAGPLFYRLLITGGSIDEQLAEGVVELIMRGFAPTGRSRPTSESKGAAR
jgi:AcrR family transcriptional regulator